MTIGELSRMLAQRAESVCRHLLPGGKREGERWHIGGLDGSKGRSLHVSLAGESAGRWCDECTGEYGDLIDLWREVNRLSALETLHQVRAYLGIESPSASVQSVKRKKTYSRPKPCVGLAHEGTAAWKYLTGRGIDPETIQAFKPGEERGTLIFRYASPEGKHVHSKFMKLARKDGKKQTWVSTGTPPILYGWQAMKETDRSVVICEGETDCMTLRSLGIPALSIPMGAGEKQGQWIELEYDRLDRFEEIFIWMDHDEAGQAAAKDIVNRLGAHRCRVVEWPDQLEDGSETPEGCDVNDLIHRHSYTAKDIAKLIMAARCWGPEDLASAGAFKDEVDAIFDGGDEQLQFALPWADGEPVDFRDGELSIWSGHGSSGKSLILGQLILYANRRNIRALIASMEMKPGDTLQRMLRQATGIAKPEKPFRDEVLDWLDDKLWLFMAVGTAKADRLLEVSRYAVRRYGIKHIVIDSLMKLGIREDDYPGQKAMVERLCDFALETGCHVHLVAHQRKPQNGGDDASGFAIKGSGGIRDLAHNVLILKRNKTKENALADPELSEEDRQKYSRQMDAYLTLDKNRRHGWEGRIGLRFDAASLQYLPYRALDPVPIYCRAERPYGASQI